MLGNDLFDKLIDNIENTINIIDELYPIDISVIINKHNKEQIHQQTL